MTRGDAHDGLLVAAKMALEALPIALWWALREDSDGNPIILALRAAIAKAEEAKS